MKNADGHIHVIPNGLEHVEDKNCWCHPELIYKDEFTHVEVGLIGRFTK